MSPYDEIDKQTGKPGAAMGVCWAFLGMLGVLGWIIIAAIIGALS